MGQYRCSWRYNTIDISKLQIGVQETRKLWPDLSDDALLALAKTVHGLSRDNV